MTSNYNNINIKADEQTLESLFNRKAVYEGPEYQRRFSWGREQFNELWDDIQEGIKHERLHSLGEIKLVPMQGNDPEKLQIIDGQQRLTTLSVMIAALRDEYEKRGEADKYITQLEELLQTKDRDANLVRTLKLLDVYGDDDVYESIYTGDVDVDALEGPVATAYQFFVKKLSSCSGEKLDALRKYIIDGLSFIRTEVDDLDQAYIIFETQNRGLDLDVLQRAKALIMQIAHRRSTGQTSEVQRIWTKIIRRCGQVTNTEYKVISNVLIVNSPVNVFTAKLGDVKQNFVDNMAEVVKNTDESVVEFLHWLESEVERYVKLKQADVSKYSDSQNSHINSLIRQFSAKNSWDGVVVYDLFNRQEKPGEIINSLNWLSKLSLRLYMSGAIGSEKRDAMRMVLRSLRNGSGVVEAVKRAMRNYTPKDPALKLQLENKEFKRNKATRFILYRIESQHFGGDAVSGCSYPHVGEDVQVEHIAPQLSFSANKYSRWRSVLNHDENRFEESRNLLGNLTLLRSRQNQAAGDEPFADKCQKYRVSDFNMSCVVEKGYDGWGFEQIESRTEKMAQLAVEAFSASPSSPKKQLSTDKNGGVGRLMGESDD